MLTKCEKIADFMAPNNFAKTTFIYFYGLFETFNTLKFKKKFNGKFTFFINVYKTKRLICFDFSRRGNF